MPTPEAGPNTRCWPPEYATHDFGRADAAPNSAPPEYRPFTSRPPSTRTTAFGAGRVGDGSHSIHELPGGPVLGVVPDTEYREETFTLEEDAALVMVTDGVVEGPSLTLEDGLERVGTLAGAAVHDGLNAEETADCILDSAVEVDHLDDVAVLVIRRT
ncbi:SpoIIE family protein phosphatase [Streptomyces sp. NPDC056192]|uniref:SpoIIE family protein phosphatase n=1 Tax=unclassified Streptomyces TaxID=2593676 RepID=UPI0035E06EB7